MKLSKLIDLLDRYLKDEVNEDEKKLVDEWYQTFDARGNDVLEPQENSGIGQESSPPEDASSENKIRYFRILSSCAAAVLVVLTGLWWFKSRQTEKTAPVHIVKTTTFSTGTSQVKKLELPDGSLCWLNANTKVEIRNDFAVQSERNVRLIEGEAYFDVKKDPRKPFIVQSGKLQTRVLGTTFNVKAYQYLHKQEVTVLSGRVGVSHQEKDLGILNPDQQLKYNEETQSFNIQKVKSVRVNWWIRGKTQLQDASFDDLAMVMHNYYGIMLKPGGQEQQNYRFTLCISTAKSLEATLKIICSVHQNSYRREKDEIIID